MLKYTVTCSNDNSICDERDFRTKNAARETENRDYHFFFYTTFMSFYIYTQAYGSFIHSTPRRLKIIYTRLDLTLFDFSLQVYYEVCGIISGP